MDLSSQRIADRYDIIRLLGEGGMGQVYEARHVELEKRVAIKFLARELAADEELLARFRREARITASLRHANIVEVMDFGVADGQPYLVMEYLSGESLSGIIEREGQLSVPAARKIMTQMLSGIAEAHSLGIVHRDIKPDNVFLDEVRGQGTVVKLLDFGISKVASRDGRENLQLTKTGVVMGTPNYMSPEQVMGSGEIDGRADLYACGVILFEMLTGRRPFEGETHNEVVVRIMSDPIPDMLEHRPDLDPALVQIVLKALSRQREHRFATAEEFIEALETYDPDQPSVSLTSLRITPVPATPSRRRSWLWPVAIAGGFLSLAVIVSALVVILRTALGAGGGERITVTPRGAPEAAVIHIDGEEYPADIPFQVHRGDEPLFFRVEAPGFQSGEFEIVPEEDQQVRIHLLPLGEVREDPPAKEVKKKSATSEKTSEKKPKKKSRNPFRRIFRSLK